MQERNTSPKSSFGTYLILVLTAAIWGFAFVAQRKGMEYIDPLLFNGIRFALGAFFLAMVRRVWTLKIIKDTWQLGVVLFVAASFQQYGMIWTTAGNAGFITGLYVVFVPLIGIYRGQKLSRITWVSILLALGGLYLLSNRQSIDINFGNALVLISALFWALHVQYIDKFAKKHEAFELALGQFAVCAILSLSFGIAIRAIENPLFLFGAAFYRPLFPAILPILYGGILSVGVAYSLQVYAQQKSQPTIAALILCSESLFALFGGWLILGESISLMMLLGAGLLLMAMLLNLFMGDR